MGVDCKSTSYAYAGSNPAWPTIFAIACAICFYRRRLQDGFRPCGSVVEHTLGKGEVTSSILVMGFFNFLSPNSTALLNDSQTSGAESFVDFVDEGFVGWADFAARKHCH